MRSKAESPPLGPIRTLALYREGEGRRMGVGGGEEENESGWLAEREGRRGEEKKLLSYDIHNLCRGAFPAQVCSP